MLIERGHYDGMTDDFVQKKAVVLSSYLQSLLVDYANRTNGKQGQIVSRRGDKGIQIFWVAPQTVESKFNGVLWQIDEEGVLLSECSVEDSNL